MPAATTTGTDSEVSKTGPADGNSAHTDTDRAVPSSAALVGLVDSVICDGKASSSPKDNWAGLIVKPAKAPPWTDRASDSPATLSCCTCNEKESDAAEVSVPAPMVTSKEASSTV